MWIKPETMATFESMQQVRFDCPKSLPEAPSEEALKEEGYYPLTATAPDNDPITQEALPAEPQLIKGVWTQVWKIVDLDPGAAQANRIASVKAQIAALEAMQTPRRVRDAVIGADGGWLAGLEKQIAALRAQLK